MTEDLEQGLSRLVLLVHPGVERFCARGLWRSRGGIEWRVSCTTKWPLWVEGPGRRLHGQHTRVYVTKDRAALKGPLADDFHFTSPLDNRLDRDTYFRRCWRTARSSRRSTSSISSWMLIRVFVTYEGRTQGPSISQHGDSHHSRSAHRGGRGRTLAGRCLTRRRRVVSWIRPSPGCRSPDGRTRCAQTGDCSRP